MIEADPALTAADLLPVCRHVFEVSAEKIRRLHRRWDSSGGAPVFTVEGHYTARGWTEWTQGFQFGSALLQFDATGDEEFLTMGREATRLRMAPHVSHTGVHDHGFNNISTYGALLRLMNEGRIPENAWERDFYELALKLSGAVQAGRWTALDAAGAGFVHSFNGPHSLFADTIRSMRSLVVGWRLGHRMMGEGDREISLLGRALEHAESTARWNVWFGTGRDAYDIRGRVAHESIFNLTDRAWRCPSSQQGYSPFTTWTRGLAWILCGFAEQLEFLLTLEDSVLEPFGGREKWVRRFRETAEAVADFYLEHTPADGIPYWDTGAPGLSMMGDWRSRPAEIHNDCEPVDSSAAVIAAQGLLRLAESTRGAAGARWRQAGLAIAGTVLSPPYLSENEEHEGLILHSIYHRPNGWDHIPPGSRIPLGESSQWGDYHARELALLILRQAQGAPYLKFFI
ncbi:MAG: glycosyl hydrolase [Verrucomicrobiaceae bacterium]|nr:MAG: glycosyl hydrolase [Verrucomicrobiaceae bacterium]